MHKSNVSQNGYRLLFENVFLLYPKTDIVLYPKTDTTFSLKTYIYCIQKLIQPTIWIHKCIASQNGYRLLFENVFLFYPKTDIVLYPKTDTPYNMKMYSSCIPKRIQPTIWIHKSIVSKNGYSVASLNGYNLWFENIHLLYPKTDTAYNMNT